MKKKPGRPLKDPDHPRTRMFALRLPDDIHAKIAQLAKESGSSMTDVMISALRAQLNEATVLDKMIAVSVIAGAVERRLTDVDVVKTLARINELDD